MFFQGQMTTRSLTRLSTKRHYQSLAMSLNQQMITPGVTTTKEKERSSLQELISTLRHFPKKQLKTKPRLDFLRSFLGSSYSLKEDILLMAIYPEQQYTTENTKSSITSSSLDQLGRTVFNLQRSKFLLDYGSQLSSDLTEVFDSKLYKKFNRPLALATFIEEKGLLKYTQTMTRLQETPHKAAQSALFILIGGISHAHGTESAEKFIDKAIFQGKGGLLDIVSRS